MNEFWLWFWRPIAETLGVVAMLVVVMSCVLLAAKCAEWLDRRATRKRAAAAARADDIRQKAKAAL